MNLTLTGFNGATSARSWKSAGVLAPLPIALASMGPRARARGNTAANIQGADELELQWGHERALVEMPVVPTVGHNPYQLQWGHERALVEITPGLRQSLGQSCFNGATSARSWKSVMRSEEHT